MQENREQRFRYSQTKMYIPGYSSTLWYMYLRHIARPPARGRSQKRVLQNSVINVEQTFIINVKEKM
jgi:hypothetical protein